ncbi:hypothetical protein [Arenimonas sp. MALMAid1274]|uniref:hypothetical protein n=1 Tax=Arenimonas sp. MALMAid1274 TaxID=3411630 RepID=UPI003BA1271E
MPLSLRSRLALFSVLALVMAATRFNHFGSVPDASWAVFFIAGYQLRGSVRWAFPALMAIAVAVDYLVISATGQNFWTHYCVSPGYWFLLPAHFSLWAGGSLLRRYAPEPTANALALLVLAVVASVAACHLFAQGGFYWLSNSVADPTLAGWAKNYADWFLPYLRTTGMYVALATVVHLAMLAVLRPGTSAADRSVG